jgi:phosphonate transport system ATP-binding protein
MDVIKLTDVSKTFKKGNTILKNLNLTIKEGEMVGLIGPSGSGKSTLIRVLGGLEAADPSEKSKIEIFGKTTQQNGKKTEDCKKTYEKVGIIFQQFNLVGRLKLITTVLIGRLSKIPSWQGSLSLFSKEDKLIALECLEKVKMLEFANQRVSTLSGGQQQRGAIARALAQEAKIILADEPIASLDPASAHRVMKHLVNLNKKDGITILVSLHQFEVAKKMCHRIIALNGGEIVFDGEPSEIKKKDLIQLYGTESADVLFSA